MDTIEITVFKAIIDIMDITNIVVIKFTTNIPVVQVFMNIKDITDITISNKTIMDMTVIRLSNTSETLRTLWYQEHHRSHNN
jgi:hypothetical protein